MSYRGNTKWTLSGPEIDKKGARSNNTVKDSTSHEDSSSHEIYQSHPPELHVGISPSSDDYPTASSVLEDPTATENPESSSLESVEITTTEQDSAIEMHGSTYPKFYERRQKSSSIRNQTDLLEPSSQGGGKLLSEEEAPGKELDSGWPIALRKGTRSCTNSQSNQHKTLLLKTQDVSIPKTPQEALKSFH